MERYYARDWPAARARFERCCALEPCIPGQTPGVLSNPSLIYLDIVARLAREPPLADWDGVYVMKEK